MSWKNLAAYYRLKLGSNSRTEEVIGECIIKHHGNTRHNALSDGRHQAEACTKRCVVVIQPSGILRQTQFKKTARRDLRSDLLMRFHGKIFVSACPERNLQALSACKTLPALRGPASRAVARAECGPDGRLPS